MPHYTVHLREEALNGTVEPKLISGLTDVVSTVFGERFRPLVAVDLIGVPQRRRGVGGTPSADDNPVVTLSLREPAYHVPELPDAPARLVAGITDALAAPLGEHARAQTVVTLVGVPEGRSGTAGEVA